MKALFFTVILTSFGFSQGNWQVLENAPDTGSRLEDVFFITPGIGWAISLQGRVYKTTDGGANWILQFSSPGAGFRSIGFADSLHGWIGTLIGPPYLWQTSDGGKTWTGNLSITGPTVMGICGIWAASDSIIYGAGRYNGNPRLIKTIDKGANWVSFDMSAYANTLVDCYFFNPDTGFVV